MPSSNKDLFKIGTDSKTGAFTIRLLHPRTQRVVISANFKTPTDAPEIKQRMLRVWARQGDGSNYRDLTYAATKRPEAPLRGSILSFELQALNG